MMLVVPSRSIEMQSIISFGLQAPAAPLPGFQEASMKAIRVHQTGGPEVMVLETVSEPVAGAGQVVVRIHAAGVNPVDVYIRAASQGRQPDLPYTPGSDGAGVIEAVGPGVEGVAGGDRVYLSGTAAGPYVGTYAEEALCLPANVHRLPDRLSFAQGAAVNVPYATAYRALFDRARAEPGEVVLVHGGSGGVGIASIQIARAHGMTVFATAGTERGRALVADQGARRVFDHHAPDYMADILAATSQRGVNVIIEMLANVNLDTDLGLLARSGRVVVVGNRGRVEIDARQTMSRDTAILGMALTNTTADDRVRIHAALVAGLASGTLRPVVGRELPLADAPAAHVAVMEPGAYGKIVLVT
jgi:NADPH2:quinone reductase